MGMSVKTSLFSTGCTTLKRPYMKMYKAYFRNCVGIFFFLEGLGIHITFELTGLFYREPVKRSLHCHISEMSVTTPKLFLRTVEAGATFEGHK